VREFLSDPVPDDVLREVVELSRFAPSGYNSQGYSFKTIRDQKILARLAALSGDGTAPIGRAPMAIAIVVDPEVSVVPVEDGCIATYHFMLAAATCGLGTCWIGSLDRDEAKSILGIPPKHHLVTVTPLGYAAGSVAKPERKPASHFVRD
jgi:nitroreductase